MLGSFFKKNESDLDGYNFKKSLENTPNAVLIDVRTPEEYKAGTIEDALNLDFMAPDFNRTAEQMDNDKTYFLFCRSGNRSSSAVKTFEGLGFKAFNLVGGIGAWPSL
ncbi:MAG: rhodanese-like domain-containing protein [Daejeonella sp.]